MPTITAFNEISADEARELLLSCCASAAFADAVVAGRPYSDVAALVAAATTVVPALDWADVEDALNAHPRIGERAAGGSREARWSRAEQAAATNGDRHALTEGNKRYEDRFGHVFLICATGLSSGEILAALRERLGNDEGKERSVVRDELAKITELRLRKLAE